MDRRDFLRTAALASTPALLGMHSGVSRAEAALAPEATHGDVTMQTLATDHYRLVFTPAQPRPLRLLQLTDTHFHPGDTTNDATDRMLRTLVAREKPDFVVHTGDFVNNDSKDKVEWQGLEILNGLGTPWTLCFGNHDYPVHQAPGALPLDEVRRGMKNGFQGYVDEPSGRHYCYRYDVHTRAVRAEDGGEAKPAACLFFFQVGYATGDRRISDPQLAWLTRQLEQDAKRGVDAPITVFVHIPLLEYHQLFESGKARGQRGEAVCYDSDTGESFEKFSASRRVNGVFCGHDHVNNFAGQWQEIELAYGRVTGWGGYGPADWPRGGRLLTLDLQTPRAKLTHAEVF